MVVTTDASEFQINHYFLWLASDIFDQDTHLLKLH